MILYYIAMFSGLVVLFLTFELATLIFYPHAGWHAGRQIAVFADRRECAFVVGLLATRIPWVAQTFNGWRLTGSATRPCRRFKIIVDAMDRET